MEILTQVTTWMILEYIVLTGNTARFHLHEVTGGVMFNDKESRRVGLVRV